ncbi:hypothetical protein JYU34_012922 [Plutella xylostella]|uniref:Uncharacterized protein n=1 Tax=Plutella xylostella TaxID=51655 RepID=A0ABQ7QDU2_PLUXY|nr:hypothetical protein JYU34_012922 [Plutella xylostella]
MASPRPSPHRQNPVVDLGNNTNTPLRCYTIICFTVLHCYKQQTSDYELARNHRGKKVNTYVTDKKENTQIYGLSRRDVHTYANMLWRASTRRDYCCIFFVG